MYGKLENNKLVFAPKSIIEGNTRIINPNSETLAKFGYKELIRSEIPELEYNEDAEPLQRISTKYEERGSQILINYILVPTESIED